jgi:hypothetical protein
MRFLPIDEEVRQGLRLDRLSRLVGDVVDTDLNCPLGNSLGRITIEDDIRQGVEAMAVTGCSWK